MRRANAESLHPADTCDSELAAEIDAAIAENVTADDIRYYGTDRNASETRSALLFSFVLLPVGYDQPRSASISLDKSGSVSISLIDFLAAS